MLTVRILRAQLAAFEDDLPVKLCVIERSGAFHDRASSTAGVVDVELHPASGTVTAVWLTGSTPAPNPPAVLTARCGCGQTIQIDDHEMWPDAHYDH